MASAACHGLFQRHAVESSSTASAAALSGESARLRSRSSRARRSRITSSGCASGCGARAELVVAAQAPHFGSGVQKDLYLCVGKDNRANVAALHHHPALCAHLLLQADHPGANGGKDAYPGCCVGDDLIAEQAGNVFAVEQNAIFRFARFQADRGFGGQGFQGPCSRPEGDPPGGPSGRRRGTWRLSQG